MDVVTCRGSNYEIGYTHGSFCRAKVLQCLENYKSMFWDSKGMKWEDAQAIAKDYLGTLERVCPHLVEEMKGIADGAGVGFMDILALNVRSEIALSSFGDGCSSLYWRDDSVNTSFLAQNWDWREEQGHVLVHLTIELENRKLFIMTEAGIVGKIGCNSDGVGVTLNAIRTSTIDNTRLPVHIAIRMAAESGSVAEAVTKLESIGTAYSSHICIADPTTAVGLEVNPRKFGKVLPDARGQICHTNHNLEARLPDEDPLGYLKDTFDRYDRLHHLSHTNKASASFASIREILSDEVGAPGSISRFTCLEDPPHLQAETLFSIIMDLTHKTYEIQLWRPSPKKPVFRFLAI